MVVPETLPVVELELFVDDDLANEADQVVPRRPGDHLWQLGTFAVFVGLLIASVLIWP